MEILAQSLSSQPSIIQRTAKKNLCDIFNIEQKAGKMIAFIIYLFCMTMNAPVSENFPFAVEKMKYKNKTNFSQVLLRTFFFFWSTAVFLLFVSSNKISSFSFL